MMFQVASVNHSVELLVRIEITVFYRDKALFIPQYFYRWESITKVIPARF